MTNEELLEKAREIATEAHKWQVDKGGKPYIGHPLRVAERCTDIRAKIVAVLHDVLEDTEWTVEGLQEEGFPQEITDALVGVTRPEEESYDDFIIRAGKNPISRAVKIADLEDNMDIRRLRYPMDEWDFKRLNKYLKSYEYLKKLN